MDSERARWLVVIHLTFVVSGVLLAAMNGSPRASRRIERGAQVDEGCSSSGK